MKNLVGLVVLALLSTSNLFAAELPESFSSLNEIQRFYYGEKGEGRMTTPEEIP